MIIHAFIHDDNLFIHHQFICRSLYLNLGSLHSYPLLLKQSKKHGIEYANLATSLPIHHQQQQQQQQPPSHLEDHHHHHHHHEDQHHHRHDHYQDDSNSIYYDHHLHMLLIDYFQLSIKLQPLYDQWSTCCPRMAIVSQHLPGMAVVGSRDGLDRSRDGLDYDLDHFCHHHNDLIIIIMYHFNQSSI